MATDEFNISALREEIKKQMSAKGIRAKELSKRAGLNETAVRDLIERVDDPRINTLHKLARALGMTPASLFGGLVQVGGCVREGGEIFTAPECGCVGSFVPRPPVEGGELMAFRVDGHGMMPVYRDGDIVYVARGEAAQPENCLGEECVIQLASGAHVLRQLSLGSRSNIFNLDSVSAPTIKDVQVAWVAPVLFVMRSRAGRPKEEAG